LKRSQLPARAEIWLVDFDPAVGREQGGRRPALVVSSDTFNHGPAGLLLTVPITSVAKAIVSHVPIAAGASGLERDSFAMCEQVRCISRERLQHRIGRAPRSVVSAVGRWLRVFLEL
jgi:mRNA interferase MazF